MLSFFRSKKNKTPKKGGSFYHRENLIQTIEELNTVLSQLDSTDSIKTEKNLVFQGLELDTIVTKNLENDFGEESFLLDAESGIENHTVYFYRIVSDYFRFLLQIHFVDDQFFFAATKVYAETLLSAADKKKVIMQIANKYYPDADSEIINFNIRDPKGNILSTHDDVYYHIKYLPNNNTSRTLKKKFESFKKVDSGQVIKETLDRLI